jgi:glycosyltransferase involved in cell wall biosynthesis
MPARNAETFIRDAVHSVVEGGARYPWELLIVDDHSSDDTRRICLEIAAMHPEVQVLQNTGKGKIAALNLAYSKCRGQLITTLDADDCLRSAFFRCLEKDSAWDSMCRDYALVDSDLRPLGTYHIGKAFLKCDFKHALASLRSIPRASWTVRRKLAEKLFPIPEDLPFEDVWFSLVAKRFSSDMRYIARPLYAYRQHSGQTYGGVFNYRPRITIFRASRLERYAALLPRHQQRLETVIGRSLEPTRRFYQLMADPGLTSSACIRSGLPPAQLFRVFLFRRLWPLMSIAKRLQWALSKIL